MLGRGSLTGLVDLRRRSSMASAGSSTKYSSSSYRLESFISHNTDDEKDPEAPENEPPTQYDSNGLAAPKIVLKPYEQLVVTNNIIVFSLTRRLKLLVGMGY
jgi:hypothetical protein